MLLSLISWTLNRNGRTSVRTSLWQRWIPDKPWYQEIIHKLIGTCAVCILYLGCFRNCFWNRGSVFVIQKMLVMNIIVQSWFSFVLLFQCCFSVRWCIFQLNRFQMCFYFVCFHKINTEDTIPELFLNDMKAFNFMDYFSISRFIWYSSLSQTYPCVRPFLFRVHVSPARVLHFLSKKG